MKKLMSGNEVIAEGESFSWVPDQYGWSDGKTIYADTDKSFTVAADLPKVSPVEFKLLFTSAERLAINAARQSDLALDDFYKILDDPRLTEVDMNLESNQAAIEYALSVAGARLSPAYTEEDVATRKAQILSGELK